MTKHFIKDDKDTLTSKININRYSDFGKLIRVTARILAMYQYKEKPKSSFKHAGRSLPPSDVAKAEKFGIMEAQKRKIQTPVRINVVGGRGERWTEMNQNKNEVIILPYNNRFSRL